ncbi:hypothetical protein BB465_07575 [Helicobacter pylori]|nr:hypothetical protein BB465_07575 [Helicobacter pylori]
MTSSSNHSFKEQDFHIPIALIILLKNKIPAGACLYSLLESIAKARALRILGFNGIFKKILIQLKLLRKG